MSGAMLREPVIPKDSESDEKASSVNHDQSQFVVKGDPAAGLPPDPDAHLTDEERAAIVSRRVLSQEPYYRSKATNL